MRNMPMKYINNVEYLNNNTYYPLGVARQSGGNDFDSVFEAETVVYATPESANTQASSGKNVSSTKNITCPAELEAIFNRAAKEYNVDENLLKAVAQTESNFNTNATSSVGAMGVMQLMPGTAQALGVTDAYNPEQNIMGGARYLSQMLHRYDGNVSLALAAYNAGPGNVDQYGGIPPFEETQNYVKKILANMGHNDITHVTATTVSAIPTSESDITVIYAVAASDVTNSAKLNL